VSEPPGETHTERAQRLLEQFRAGKPKSRIEFDEWDDATSHGARFNTYIKKQLGIDLKKSSKQSARHESPSTTMRHYLTRDPRRAILAVRHLTI